MVHACGFKRFAVFFKVRFGEADAGDVGNRVDAEFLLDKGGDLDGLSRTGATRALGAADEIGMQFCCFPQKFKYVFKFFFLFRGEHLERETCTL